MKARICVNLYDKLNALLAQTPGPMDAGEQYVKNFCDTVSGEVVELVFVHGDAFEKHDNNIWLPHELWAPMPEDAQVTAMGCAEARRAYAEWLQTPEGQASIKRK